MLSGVNIADGSVASKEFVASIYGLRRGDFQFMSAFDREMFFKLFHIPSKSVRVYYRDASRGKLLGDAEEIVTRDLAGALDDGQFVSLRVLGDFGGPHNVLLLARRSGTYYYHDPRSGRIVASASAVLASKILTVSKARSRIKKRYFSSYHLVAIPPRVGVIKDFRTPADFPQQMEIELTKDQKSAIKVCLMREEGAVGVAGAFPNVHFATTGEAAESVIGKNLNGARLRGVYNLTELALNSYQAGKRDLLPVWVLDGVPMVVTGYVDAEKTALIFFDGNSSSLMSLAVALGRFEKSGCYFGYVNLARD